MDYKHGSKRKRDADDGNESDGGFKRNVRARTSYAPPVGARKMRGGGGGYAGGGYGSGSVADNDGGGGDSDDDDTKQIGEMRTPAVARDGYPTSIRASGRTSVVHNQAVISFTARVDKDSYIKLLRNEPDQMMVPHSLRSGQQEVVKVSPGELALQDCSPRALSEMGPGYNNNVIFTALNGRHKRCKLRVRGIVAGDGEGGVQRRGDDAVACQAAGSNTIINTGPEPVFTGDDLIADEVPYARRREDGTFISCIEHNGAPIEKLLPAIHSVRCNDMEADLARARAVVDERIAANNGGVSPDEYKQVIEEVFDYFYKEDVRHGGVQSLKNYALFYAVNVMSFKNLKEKRIIEAIAEGLDDSDVRAHQALFGSIAGTPDTDLYRSAGDGQELRSLMTRCMQRAVDLLRDRFRRLRIGKCLKGAPPGQQIDVAFGTHSTL